MGLTRSPNSARTSRNASSRPGTWRRVLGPAVRAGGDARSGVRWSTAISILESYRTHVRQGKIDAARSTRQDRNDPTDVVCRSNDLHRSVTTPPAEDRWPLTSNSWSWSALDAKHVGTQRPSVLLAADRLPAEHDRHLRQLLSDHRATLVHGGEMIDVGHRESDRHQVRGTFRRVEERRRRRVRSEIGDVPPVQPHQVAEHRRGKRVVLTDRSSDHQPPRDRPRRTQRDPSRPMIRITMPVAWCSTATSNSPAAQRAPMWTIDGAIMSR